MYTPKHEHSLSNLTVSMICSTGNWVQNLTHAGHAFYRPEPRRQPALLIKNETEPSREWNNKEAQIKNSEICTSGEVRARLIKRLTREVMSYIQLENDGAGYTFFIEVWMPSWAVSNTCLLGFVDCVWWSLGSLEEGEPS